MLDKSTKERFDWLLFITLCLIVAVGVMFIWSAKSFAFAKRQLIWTGVAMTIFFSLLKVNYLTLALFAYPLYWLAVLGLVFVLIPHNPLAQAINGANRWITLGFVNVQPSEFVKIAMVLALSRYLMYRKNYRTLPGLIGPFVLAMIPIVLILKEPDLGTSLVFLPILFVLLFAAGAKLWHLLTIIGLGMAACPVLYFCVMEPYQQDRIRAFLDPAKYSSSTAYQLNQSLIAVGSGGVFGKGWSRGTQNLLDRVPEPHTDFIFSVLGEELGFLGSSFVLLLYFVLLLCGLGIARRTREPCGRLIAAGVVTMFAVQILVNVGMTIGIAPITGMPLPFISYGGSSLVASFLALALVMNVAMRRTPVLAASDFEFSDKKD